MQCATGLGIGWGPFLQAEIITIEDLKVKSCEWATQYAHDKTNTQFYDWSKTICMLTRESTTYESLKTAFCKVASEQVKNTAVLLEQKARADFHWTGIRIATVATAAFFGGQELRENGYIKLGFAMESLALAGMVASVGLYVLATLKP